MTPAPGPQACPGCGSDNTYQTWLAACESPDGEPGTFRICHDCPELWRDDD